MGPQTGPTQRSEMDIAEGTTVAAAGGAQRLAPWLVATQPARAAELWERGPGRPAQRDAGVRGRFTTPGFLVFLKNVWTGEKQNPIRLRSTRATSQMGAHCSSRPLRLSRGSPRTCSWWSWPAGWHWRDRQAGPAPPRGRGSSRGTVLCRAGPAGSARTLRAFHPGKKGPRWL